MFKSAPLLLSLALALAGSAACYDEAAPQVNCESCDEVSTKPTSTEVLFEFTSTEESELAAQIEAFSSVFDTKLNSMGFGTKTIASRGSEPVASIDFRTDTVLMHDGYALHWSGLIQQGGSLKLERYASGAEVLLLDFGTQIYTADDQVVAPNLDRFAVKGEQRLILSNWTKKTGGKYRAQDSASEFLNGETADVLAQMRVAMVPDANDAVATYSGSEAVDQYEEFIRPSRVAYSESLGVIRRVNGKGGVTFLLEASVKGSIDSIPVSVFRNYGDGSGNTPVTAFGFEGGPGDPAEYLQLVANEGVYAIEGTSGLDMVYDAGIYTIYVALGDDHDDPESVYKFQVKNGSPDDKLVQICNNYDCL